MSGLVGYARVSTRDQDYDGQIVELKAAGFTRIPLRAARISAPRLAFGTTHDLLLSLVVLSGLRPGHQVRSAYSPGLSMD